MSALAFQDDTVQGVYERAASLAKKGKSKTEVREHLKSLGLSDEGASTVADNIFELRTRTLKESGQLNMLYGALFFIGGLVALALSYAVSAQVLEGGQDFIVWGAIVFGAIQFFHGLFQAGGGD